MHVDQNKLIAAMRRRYKQPADAVRALLGKDAEAALLNSPPGQSGKHNFRVALEQLLSECKNLSGSELEKIYNLLDQHVPLGAAVADRGRDEHEELDDRRHDEDRGTADRTRARDQEKLEELDDDDDGEAATRKFLREKASPRRP